MMIRLMILEDHGVTLSGTKLFLSKDDELQVVAEAVKAEDMLNKLKDTPADIILSDISLPGMNGLEFCRIVRESHPGIKIIILSASTEREVVQQAFGAGASGYLSKRDSMHEMIFAIKNVHNGRTHISSSVSEDIAKGIVFKNQAGEKSMLTSLSEREAEIFKMLAEGLSYKEIAEQLKISYRTVETHKANIFDKLDLQSIAELVKLAIREKVISI